MTQFYEKERADYEKSSGREKLTPNSNPQEIASKLPKVNVPDFVSKVKKPKK
jgi:hypothetical protein